MLPSAREVPAVRPGATRRRHVGVRVMPSEAELKAAGEKYIPKDYDPALYKLRHSLAHVMAQAVVEKFPQAKPTIGPPIEYGFYYDFDLDVNPTDKDIEDITNRMRRDIKGNLLFRVRE